MIVATFISYIFFILTFLGFRHPALRFSLLLFLSFVFTSFVLKSITFLKFNKITTLEPICSYLMLTPIVLMHLVYLCLSDIRKPPEISFLFS